MNTPDDVLADARTYMRIYFVGVIFLLIYNIGSGILRAIGDSKRPLYVLIVCCLCNVALDLLFVCVFHMGVAGAAIATIATEGVSSVIILIMLARSNDCYRLNLKKIRIDRSLLGDILRIGFPAGLQSMMYSISNVFIQANVNSFGTNVAAGWTAYGKIDRWSWTRSAFPSPPSPGRISARASWIACIRAFAPARRWRSASPSPSAAFCT